eukprot:169919_1
MSGLSSLLLTSAILAIAIFAQSTVADSWKDKDKDTDTNRDDDRCSTEHRHRKPWHEIPQSERDLYISGFKKLNENGKQWIFTATHADDYALHQAHANSAFPPWHRYFLWEFESAIRDLGGEHKCFSLPYWDFSYEMTQTHDVSKWTILNSGLGGSGDPNDNYCVKDSVFGKGEYEPLLCWEGLDNDDECCLVRQSCDEACCTMYSPAEMMDMILSYDIYGTDSNRGPNPPEFEVYGFSKVLEMRHGLNHDVIGGWIDETRTSLGHMANLSYSPDDPVFYLLHSYVDYNWALWQDCHDYDLVAEKDITENIYGGTLGEPDGIDQEWGPSTIDVELRYPPLEEAKWSYLTKNNWKITPRDMHNMARWDVSYEKGSFFRSAKVEQNCENINPIWFYNDGESDDFEPHNLNKEFSDATYDLLDEELCEIGGKLKKDMVHKWAQMDCNWHQSKDECSELCVMPKYFDDCSDMPRDRKTKDIYNVTLGDLLEKVSMSECMQRTRRQHWNWAVQTHNLKGLCRGDFDHFCDGDFLHDGKPNECKKEQEKQSWSYHTNNVHNSDLPSCDSTDTVPCIVNSIDDYMKIRDVDSDNMSDHNNNDYKMNSRNDHEPQF